MGTCWCDWTGSWGASGVFRDGFGPFPFVLSLLVSSVMGVNYNRGEGLMIAECCMELGRICSLRTQLQARDRGV